MKKDLFAALVLTIILAINPAQAKPASTQSHQEVSQPPESDSEAKRKVLEKLQVAGIANPGGNPQILNGLAYDALYVAKNRDKALQLFRWNLALFPSGEVHANLLDSLAEGLIQVGDRSAAIKALEEALSITPIIQSNPDAAKHLAMLKADPKNVAALQAKLSAAYFAANPAK